MRGHWSVLLGAVLVVAPMRAAADEPSASEMAREALREAAKAGGLSPLLAKVEALGSGDLNALRIRRDLDALAPARVTKVLEAMTGGATLTGMAGSAATVRVDLLAFASGSRARRYLDSLATSVLLVSRSAGAVTPGAGANGARAGFRGTRAGPSPRLHHAGRWGRWVASAQMDAAALAGPGGRLPDLGVLVDAALEAIAARDATRAEPTVRDAWMDAPVREDAFEEAVAAVESVCRAKFRRRPTFRVPTTEELHAALVREFRAFEPSATEEQIEEAVASIAPRVQGVYLPTSHSLFVLPQNMPAPAESKEVGWAGEVFMRVLFAHELTHALDFERFPMHEIRVAAKDDPGRSMALAAVSEGHAEWVAQKAATDWGIPEGFAFAAATQQRTPCVETLWETTRSVEATRDLFQYQSGLAFFQAVEEARGFAGVEEVFARPPESVEEIDRPALWLDPGTPMPSGYTNEWIENPIAKALPAPAQVLEMLTLRAGLGVHLAFLPEAERKDALRGYEGGHGFRATLGEGGLVDATVLRFATEADALRFVAVLRRVSEAKDRMFAAGVDRFEDAVYEPRVAPDGPQEAFVVTRVLVAGEQRVEVETRTARAGSAVLEMKMVGVGAARRPALRAAYQEHLAALAARARPR
jgi:hypothetical protein